MDCSPASSACSRRATGVGSLRRLSKERDHHEHGPHEDSIAALLSDLSQESADLIREQLRLVVTDIAAEGRQVGTSVGLLGGAAVLGVGAFGALTAALIAALGRRPARGGLLVATLYGAGAAGLADAGRKRLGKVAPRVLETIQRDVTATAKGASRSAGSIGASRDAAADAPRKLPAKGAPRKPAAKGAQRKPAAKGARRKPAGDGTRRKSAAKPAQSAA